MVDAADEPAGDRGLIEEAVRTLVSAAPAGWAQIHGEFEPASQPAVAVVSVTTQQGSSQPLAVSARAMTALAKQQQSAAAAGAPWRRLVIDCHADGRLSARAERFSEGSGSSDPQRWPRCVLAVLTVAFLIGAGLVLAVGWQWSPPPRVAMIPVPPPPPRQQEAFDVISRWYDADNHSNAAGMRAVTCANPGREVANRITLVERHGEKVALTYPEAISSFTDDSGQFKAELRYRMHPLDEATRQQVAKAETDSNGFFFDYLFLVDEGGQLKLCDLLPGAES
ncbi:hypothetical protein MUNTM_22500 [Mycobacterium sp. MUNTM1]